MADVSHKACSRCGEVKPAAEFTADRRASSGLQPACKECTRTRVREHRYRDLEANRAYQREYYAKNAEKKRQDAALRRDADRELYRATARAGYRRNKAKHIATVTAIRKANPDRYKPLARASGARRRSKLQSGASPAETRTWMNAQKKVCYWCGTRCAKDFHVDHYVPISRGGPHELSNLVIACPSCNLTKAAKDPFDFAREVGRLL